MVNNAVWRGRAFGSKDDLGSNDGTGLATQVLAL